VLLEYIQIHCLVHLNSKIVDLCIVAKERVYLKNKISHGSKGTIPNLIPKREVLDKKITGELKLMISPEYSLMNGNLSASSIIRIRCLRSFFSRRKDPDLENWT